MAGEALVVFAISAAFTIALTAFYQEMRKADEALERWVGFPQLGPGVENAIRIVGVVVGVVGMVWALLAL